MYFIGETRKIFAKNICPNWYCSSVAGDKTYCRQFSSAIVAKPNEQKLVTFCALSPHSLSAQNLPLVFSMISFCSNPEKWCEVSASLSLGVRIFCDFAWVIVLSYLFIWVRPKLTDDVILSNSMCFWVTINLMLQSLNTFNTINLGQGKELYTMNLRLALNQLHRNCQHLFWCVKSQGGELRAEEISIYIHCRVQEGPGTCDNMASLHF